jgi:hypothetical protein
MLGFMQMIMGLGTSNVIVGRWTAADKIMFPSHLSSLNRRRLAQPVDLRGWAFVGQPRRISLTP